VSFYDDASLVLIPSGVKTSKVYSQKPTNGNGDLTFSRASTATRTNESGVIESVASNVPRLDYSGGATCPRLLLEPQRTNLALQSENFSTTWTTNNLSVTTNVVNSPDGTLTADEIVSTTSANANVGISQAITIVNNTTYSASFYVKPNTQRYIFIGLTAVGGVQHYVTVVIDTDDFTVGQTAVGTTSGTLVSTNIEAASNGFYRVTLTASINRTDGRIRIGFANAKTGNFINATGDVAVTGSLGNSLYLWGAQVEAGAFRSTYIPTTTATVTRLADNASKTGISSLIGQTEGTIYFEGTFSDTQSSQAFMELTGLAPAINFQLAAGLFYFFSASQWSIFAAVSPNVRYKIAAAYKNNDIVLYINGVQRGTDTTASVTAKSNFYMNMRNLGDLHTDMRADQVLLFPTRLTNAQMQELTTL
jgi:hypothetical protein